MVWSKKIENMLEDMSLYDVSKALDESPYDLFLKIKSRGYYKLFTSKNNNERLEIYNNRHLYYESGDLLKEYNIYNHQLSLIILEFSNKKSSWNDSDIELLKYIYEEVGINNISKEDLELMFFPKKYSAITKMASRLNLTRERTDFSFLPDEFYDDLKNVTSYEQFGLLYEKYILEPSEKGLVPAARRDSFCRYARNYIKNNINSELAKTLFHHNKS